VEAFKISGDNKKVLNLTITILQKDMKSKDLKKNFYKEMHKKWKWNPIYKKICDNEEFKYQN